MFVNGYLLIIWIININIFSTNSFTIKENCTIRHKSTLAWLSKTKKSFTDSNR